MDAFILSLIPVGTDPRFRDILALVLAHKCAAAIAAVFASGLAAPALAWMMNHIPMEWWYSFVRAMFWQLSRFGNTRLGQVSWKPIETAFIKFIGGTADAAEDGLMKDDVSLPTVPKP